jgi:Arrestin (or S-antigen), N-terminal domain
MNEKTQIDYIDLDPSKNFLYCCIEFDHYTAGDRVNGELMLNIISDIASSKLIIKSFGYETLSVKKPLSEELFYSNLVFDTNSVIYTWDSFTPSGQYNFPFTFKLPYFAPASFHFKSYDKDENLVECKVYYEVQAELETNGGAIITDIIPIIIYNNKDRGTIVPSNSVNSLNTCCCIKKDDFFISLQQSINENPRFGEKVKFSLEMILKKHKNKFINIKGVVMYRLQLQLPGDKAYEFVYKISDFYPLNSFLMPNSWTKGSVEFEILVDGTFGHSVSSNSTGMINSEYTAEAFIENSSGLIKRATTVTVPLHVNPKITQPRQFLASSEWCPSEKSVYSFFLRTKNGTNIISSSKSCLDIN